MKLSVIYIWSNRGRTVSISQELVVMSKNIQSQNSKTTFKQNLNAHFYLSDSIYNIHFAMVDPVLLNGHVSVALQLYLQ